MPRTRQVRKVSRLNETSTAPEENGSKSNVDLVKEYYEKKREELLKSKEMALAKYKIQTKRANLDIPVALGNRKLKYAKLNSTWHTLSSTKYGSVVNSAVFTNQTINQTKKKSSDDGYLTSDSATDTIGGQSSKSQKRSNSTQKSNPVRRSSRTRSLSREFRSQPISSSTAVKKPRKSRSVSRSVRDKFKTPANTRTLDHFGMITPKMKPNTPSVVLRRPGQGEIAVSLRGSPLMTTAMVSETTANVNIPLADGRMINIQPMKGLRASEIPELDPEIQRQLQTLRDNLDKVCQLSRK